MQWSISMRPHTFNEMYGCDNVKKYFYNIVKKHADFPDVVLFQGLFGGGKTTSAKILAQMISCTNPKENGDPCCECPSCKAIMDETWDMDCMQLDSGTDGKIDAIRDKIQPFISRPSIRGNHKKVIMIEEVQEMSKDAQNALLKILERPQRNIYFIFTAMTPLPPGGLSSRCVTFRFDEASTGDIMYCLKNILEKNGLYNNKQIVGDKDPGAFWAPLLHIIATNSFGSYRQATQYLEQCIVSEYFTEGEISNSLNIVDFNNQYNFLMNILNGENSASIKSMLAKTSFSQQAFDSFYKLLAEADVIRTFGSPLYSVKKSDEIGQKDLEKMRSLALHPNFKYAVETYQKISSLSFSKSYFPRNDYIIEICNLIDKCRAPIGVTNNVPVRTTRRTVING